MIAQAIHVLGLEDPPNPIFFTCELANRQSWMNGAAIDASTKTSIAHPYDRGL